MDKVEQLAIRDTLRGNPHRFRVLVDLHYTAVFRLGFRITGNTQDAKEVAQEAFLRAYNKLGTFQANSAFSTWIHRIAMNAALNLVERRTRDLTYAAEPLTAHPLFRGIYLIPQTAPPARKISFSIARPTRFAKQAWRSSPLRGALCVCRQPPPCHAAAGGGP